MSDRTQTPLIEKITFLVPSARIAEAVSAMAELGFDRAPESIPWRDALPGMETGGKLLAGARYRENLTQQQLSNLCGIPRRHISEMENGRRPIGKKNAEKLAASLNIRPEILLR